MSSWQESRPRVARASRAVSSRKGGGFYGHKLHAGVCTATACRLRAASKWRCPTGECAPKSRWIKASRMQPLIPRDSKRWRDLYRGRAAVEREFGNLKHRFALAPLRVRGLARIQLHADLTMLARLSQALARARAVPLAA
ncbi:MAG: transposase [Gaiellaceae bacterium]